MDRIVSRILLEQKLFISVLDLWTKIGNVRADDVTWWQAGLYCLAFDEDTELVQS